MQRADGKVYCSHCHSFGIHAQRLPIRRGVFLRRRFTLDSANDARWDLHGSAQFVDTYSCVCLRISHTFFVKVVSVLAVHSRPVLQSRDSLASSTLPHNSKANHSAWRRLCLWSAPARHVRSDPVCLVPVFFGTHDGGVMVLSPCVLLGSPTCASVALCCVTTRPRDSPSACAHAGTTNQKTMFEASSNADRSFVLSVELVCLASAALRCSMFFGTGVLLLIASSIFLEFPNSSSLLSMLGEPSPRSTIACPRSWHGRELHSDRDRRRGNTPSGRPHWSASCEVETGTNLGTGGQRLRDPGQSAGKRVCRTFGVATHTQVNTQKWETGFESRWTLLWCPWRPPSLPE